MKHDITDFLVGSPEHCRWLVIESLEHLGRLRELYPQASLTVVTRHEEAAELPALAGLGIDWHILDYRQQRLPFAEESFDFVLAEPVLTEAWELYDTLMDISRKLTDVGTLYTAYLNIRYQGVLAQLRQGLFPVRDKHLYAKTEIVRILDDAVFKEINFLPGMQDDDLAAGEAWAAQGFEDFSHDLSTGKWLVEACRSTASVANLKGLYERGTRKELARLLHRIEYGVDTQKNLAELKKLCEVQMIFPEYLEDFVHEACAHPARVLALVGTAQEDQADTEGEHRQ
ncbi:class I SAM-dependent methyltransferase [Selenomonas caprae]|uniref:Class I SAM-dependent methyltransferase n=1 Tax=Selenomonas caprae TaxID=2606905 RepID=A0A5D6WMA6_9FIRM|nr:class I SAM-dependent methyltransferase [Selenomonas caprae]TYZ29017.1 class I SAM-dependent methyltransferase [Selenomonas caprae]